MPPQTDSPAPEGTELVPASRRGTTVRARVRVCARARAALKPFARKMCHRKCRCPAGPPVPPFALQLVIGEPEAPASPPAASEALARLRL